MKRTTDIQQIEGFRLLVQLHTLLIVFWLISRNYNVYETRLGGAIAELFWLPMLLLIFALPLVDIYYWNRERFRMKSRYFILLIFSLLPVLIIFLSA